MGTYYRTANPNFSTTTTSRYLTVTTAAAQQLYLSSGYTAMQVFNVGTGSLIWGGSDIAVNSGGYLFVNAARGFDSLALGWSVFLRADSVSTVVAIQELR